jgi:predicted ATPase
MSAAAKKKLVALVPPAPERPVGLLPWEDYDAFLILRNQMLTTHAPQGPTEGSLVDRLVWCEWRRRRVLAAEAAVHVAHASDRSNDNQAKIKLLQRAGLISATKVGQWVFFRRNEPVIAAFLRQLNQDM